MNAVLRICRHIGLALLDHLLIKVANVMRIDLDNLDGIEDEAPPEPVQADCETTEDEDAERAYRRAAFTVMEGALWTHRNAALPITVSLQFHETDPYAITMGVTLHVVVKGKLLGHDQQNWAFSRDLIDTALSTEDERMVGQGDVSTQYAPDRDELYIWLTGENDIKHRVDIPAAPVKEFMAASFSIVPSGAEHTELNSEIETFLTEEGNR